MRRRTLLALLWVNVAASLVHYIDNMVRFKLYPEPSWMHVHYIDGFWFLMTPLAWFGYRAYQRGHAYRAALLLYLYAAAGLVALGHYRYATPFDLPASINIPIFVEAAAAIALMVYVSFGLWAGGVLAKDTHAAR